MDGLTHLLLVFCPYIKSSRLNESKRQLFGSNLRQGNILNILKCDESKCCPSIGLAINNVTALVGGGLCTGSFINDVTATVFKS